MEQADKNKILERLREPFDAENISFKPQMVRGEKAMGIAYASPRAYYDRLSEVCGPDGWSVSFMVYPVPFTNGVKGSDKHAGKVIATAIVTIRGVGFHSSTGESWLEDENAMTGAEAQAMKRACVPFGLGEYLYHLPKFWAPYDSEKKRFKDGEEPKLPDWALPKRKCDECHGEIVPFKTATSEMSVTAVIAKAKREYSGQFCVNCMIAKKKAKETPAVVTTAA